MTSPGRVVVVISPGRVVVVISPGRVVVVTSPGRVVYQKLASQLTPKVYHIIQWWFP